jgi:hypothetical protein
MNMNNAVKKMYPPIKISMIMKGIPANENPNMKP